MHRGGDAMNSRPDWDSWALGIADAVSARADCTRSKVGAVILDAERRVVSTGYNGSPPGGPSCLAGECPRGRHYALTVPVPTAIGHVKAERCACGSAWPCADAVDPGSSYDTGPGACVACHAEQNCLLWARRSLVGCTLYVTREPCDGCLKMIKAAMLSRVVWSTPGGMASMSLT